MRGGMMRQLERAEAAVRAERRDWFEQSGTCWRRSRARSSTAAPGGSPRDGKAALHARGHRARPPARRASASSRAGSSTWRRADRGAGRGDAPRHRAGRGSQFVGTERAGRPRLAARPREAPRLRREGARHARAPAPWSSLRSRPLSSSASSSRAACSTRRRSTSMRRPSRPAPRSTGRRRPSGSTSAGPSPGRSGSSRRSSRAARRRSSPCARSAHARARAPDRRAGAASCAGRPAGAVAAVGATAVAGAAAWARAFRGSATTGAAGSPSSAKIFDREVVFTNPELPRGLEGGARAGRTGGSGAPDFEVSDIVLGTGRISGENGEDDRAPRARARRQLLRHLAGLLGERAARRPSAARSGAAATSCSSRPSSARRAATCGPGTSVAEYMAARRGEPRRASAPTTSTSCTSTPATRSSGSSTRTCTRPSTGCEQQGKARFLGFSSHTPNLVAGRGGRDRVGPLRRDDARLPPRHLADARRGDRARAPRARHGRRRDEDAEGREAPRARGLPRARGRLLPGGAQVGALESGRLVRGDLVLRAPARGRVPARLGPAARAERRRAPRGVRPPDRRHAIARRTAAPASTTARRSSPIHDVLRHRMYFEDYGHEKEAHPPLRAAREERLGVCLVQRALPRQLPGRHPDPGADERRARAALARPRPSQPARGASKERPMRARAPWLCSRAPSPLRRRGRRTDGGG